MKAFSAGGSRGRASLALLSATAALLAGCGGDAASSPAPLNDAGFVSGSGAVTIIARAERGEPVALEGPLLGSSDRLDLATLRGKVVLINIWGSWCAPCRKEAPDLEAAWQKLKGRGVQFLGVNTRDDAAGAAEAFERRYKISYPSLRDPDGRLQLAFRKTLPPRAIPSTIVLDRDGRVAARIVGVGTMRTFIALVEDVLAEGV
jgi:thiol-disulfide isomerase/thioredoxin